MLSFSFIVSLEKIISSSWGLTPQCDPALRTLKEKSAGSKLPPIKALYAEKDRLIELRDTQREDFSNHRDYERELRTVSANIDMILSRTHSQKQLEKSRENF